MPLFVDGFVIPVPKKKVDAYRKMAQKASKIFIELGALDYRECVIEDEKASCGMSFAQGIQAKPGETVVFAYVVYKSRAQRDRVNAKVMKDPRIAALCDMNNMPFDPNRMIYGGFKTIVEASA